MIGHVVTVRLCARQVGHLTHCVWLCNLGEMCALVCLQCLGAADAVRHGRGRAGQGPHRRQDPPLHGTS